MKGGMSMMKSIVTKKIVLFIFLCSFFLVAACSKFVKDPLVGKWERISDGAVVEVSKIGDAYQSKLSKVSNSLKEYSFTEKDIKWKEIKQITKNNYRGQELHKYRKMINWPTNDPYYEEFSIKIREDNTLETNGASNRLDTIQQWKKVE